MTTNKFKYQIKRFFAVIIGDIFFFWWKGIKPDPLEQIDLYEFSQELLKLSSIERQNIHSKHSIAKLNSFEKELQAVIKMIEEIHQLFDSGDPRKANIRFRKMKKKYLKAIDSIYGIDQIKKINVIKSN